MSAFHVPGVAIAVVKDGRVMKMQGYGYSNRDARMPVTTDTMFKIGSVSKQFIATAVMRLVREHRLGLDDSIAKYISDVPPAWMPITIRQLLSHTAGLRRESPVFDGMKVEPDIVIIRGAYPESLLSAPGTKYAYSNVGYDVLADGSDPHELCVVLAPVKQ
jgi:CubicO group peptidase (beta-lactamase class C family)